MKECLLGVFALVLMLNGGCAHARVSSPSNELTLLTIFLKHDQTKNLEEIQQNLTRNKFYESFPPKGTTVVDWDVVMGVGQILVIEAPVSRINDVKETLAQTTIGAFATEVFITKNKFPEVASRLANRTKKSVDQAPVTTGSLLMTLVLRPNPGKTSKDASVLASEQKLYENFPPAGASIVNWYEAQGLGDIVVLEFPAALLRPVNLSLERFGWKAYSTDFYASYDFYPIARDTFKLKNLAKKSL